MTAAALEYRIGQGIDVHRFASGRPLILGGVEIPFEKGLSGHSDADVLLHAVIDAILGAAGQSDIGTHFPDTDKKWKGASSLHMLKIAWDLVREHGWRIQNIDCTVLAQAPRLSGHIEKMKGSIAGALGVPVERCAIKATTSEGLGFVGREEGIMASCVVMLERTRS